MAKGFAWGMQCSHWAKSIKNAGDNGYIDYPARYFTLLFTMAFVAADVPTMLVMMMVSSLAMAFGMAVVGWSKRRDGFGFWTVALLINAAAHTLLILRGHVPDLWSIVLGNALVSCVFVALLAAVMQFQRRPPPWRAMLLAPLLMVGLMVFFLGDYRARVAISGYLLGGQNLWVLWALFVRRDTTGGFGAWLLMVSIALQAGVLLLRASLTGSMAPPADDLLQGDGLQTLSFMSSFCVVLLSSLGFVFMSKERTDERHRLLAAQDALTGVANRRSVISALDRDVARAVRMRESIAVMMVHIDHLQQVNAQHGHLAGDQVLCHVVNVVRERLRSQDLVGRYGGEEFLAILPDTEPAGAAEVARQLCSAVQASLCSYGETDIAVTVSIGVCGGRLEPGDSWDMLIAAADRALDRAQQGGRNRVEVNWGLHRPDSVAMDGALSPETLPASQF